MTEITALTPEQVAEGVRLLSKDHDQRGKHITALQKERDELKETLARRAELISYQARQITELQAASRCSEVAKLKTDLAAAMVRGTPEQREAYFKERVSELEQTVHRLVHKYDQEAQAHKLTRSSLDKALEIKNGYHARILELEASLAKANGAVIGLVYTGPRGADGTAPVESIAQIIEERAKLKLENAHLRKGGKVYDTMPDTEVARSLRLVMKGAKRQRELKDKLRERLHHTRMERDLAVDEARRLDEHLRHVRAEIEGLRFIQPNAKPEVIRSKLTYMVSEIDQVRERRKSVEDAVDFQRELNKVDPR